MTAEAKSGRKRPKPNDDVVWVHSQTEDGKGYNVLRKTGDEISAGAVRPLEHGKSIVGDIVKLTPRQESPALFDVEVQHSATGASTSARLAAHGPARVSNEQYRKGWDSIWATGNNKRDNSLN